MPLTTKLVALLSLAAAVAAGPVPWSVPQAPADFLDPTNAPESGMILDDGDRLVMKVECQDCSKNLAWDDEGTSLIYDLSINPTEPLKVDWTGKVRGLAWNQTIPFYPPAIDAAVIPYTYASLLSAPADVWLDEYVEDYRDTYRAVVGLTEGSSIPNEHGWHLTRVTFVNDVEAYNVSVVAVYLQRLDPSASQAASGDVPRSRIVWWEQVPLETAYRADSTYMWDVKVPAGLEYELLSQSPLPTNFELRHGHHKIKFSWLGFSFVAALSLAAVLACVAFERNRRRHESRVDMRQYEYQQQRGLLSGSTTTLATTVVAPSMRQSPVTERYHDDFIGAAVVGNANSPPMPPLLSRMSSIVSSSATAPTRANQRGRTFSQVIFSRDDMETPVASRGEGPDMDAFDKSR